MKMRNIFFLVLALMLIACGPTPQDKLVGTWQSGHEGNMQTFVFHKDGTAEWILSGGGQTDTFSLKYEAKAAEPFNKLDLKDFEEGPLQEMTLYGIVDFMDENSFIFDCEAGPRAANGDSIRPDNFYPDQTLTYTRISAE